MGVKYFGSIETAVLTPIAAPAREKAKSFETISTFIFFAFQNLKAQLLKIYFQVYIFLFLPIFPPKRKSQLTFLKLKYLLQLKILVL